MSGADIVKRAGELCPPITESMTTDEVYERVHFADALVRAIRSWRAQVAEQELDYMRGLDDKGYSITDIDGNEVWVHIGRDRKVKLRKGKSAELLAWALSNLSLDELVDCLASEWALQGAMGSRLGELKETFFETVYDDKVKVRKTMPPSMKSRLAAADRAIVSEGGGA